MDVKLRGGLEAAAAAAAMPHTSRDTSSLPAMVISQTDTIRTKRRQTNCVCIHSSFLPLSMYGPARRPKAQACSCPHTLLRNHWDLANEW